MIPDAMIADRGISKGAKVLYCAMKMLAPCLDKMVGVTVQTIVDTTGDDERSFRRRIAELERTGWVVREKKQSRYFEVEFVADWPYEVGHQSPFYSDTIVRVKRAHSDKIVGALGQNCPSTRTNKSDCAPAPYKEARAELNSEREERQERGKSDAENPRSNQSPEPPKSEPFPGVPKNLQDLAAGVQSFTDDPKMVDRLRKKVPVWFARLTASKKLKGLSDDDLIDWIHEALSESMDAKDIVKYASAVLKDWMAAGERPRKVQPAANGVIETSEDELALFRSMANGKHAT